MKERSEEATRRLTSALQSYFEALVKEPPPERWVDLIKRLNDEEERGKRRAEAPQYQKP